MSKTIAHYRSDLRIDLKDGSTLWSDDELDRCIERAVADLTRFMPLEKQFEVTVDAEVATESFTTPAASDPTYYENAKDISASSDGDTVTLDKVRPDTPRPVLLTIVDADESITAFHFIVKGYDVNNAYMEESLFYEGGLVQTGNKYFALVTEGEIDVITGNGAADTLSLGTGSNVGVWIQLSNVGIKFQTDTIASFKRDVAYEMDYSMGRISMKSGGSLVVATSYNIKYTKNRINVDISSIQDDLIRIERVEYRVGQIYQEFTDRDIWGSVLTLIGGANTQTETTDEEHIRIKYFAQQSPPNAQSAGSYPEFLDYTVQLVAAAYALFIKATQYEHQAVTDLDSLRTELGLTTSVHVLADAALAKVTTNVADADTALDAAIVQYAAAATALAKINSDDGRLYLTDADSALDNAVTALVNVKKYLDNNSTEDAAGLLGDITSKIAELRNKVETSLDASNAYIDAVSTTDLDKATVGAGPYLETGDDTIDQLNDGESVPALYSEYSKARGLHGQVRTQAALGYVQEASARLTSVLSYIQQADSYSRIASGFALEAQQYISEAAGRVGIADRYLAEAINRVAIGNGYVAEATGRLGMSSAFVEEAAGRLATIDRYLAEASQYQVTANTDMLLVDRFRAAAIERRNEAFVFWSNPSNYTAALNLGARATSAR